jgi:hypothetical protein
MANIFNYLTASYLFSFLALAIMLIKSLLEYNKIKVRLINAKKGEK